jgi:hypothetical protein
MSKTSVRGLVKGAPSIVDTRRASCGHGTGVGAKMADLNIWTPVSPSQVVKPSQNEGLYHMVESPFHRLEANLDRVPKYASVNPDGKGSEVVGLFEGLGVVSHPGGNLTELGIDDQVGPCGALGTIVHCCSPNCCPCSVEITLQQRADGVWTLVHKHCCGKRYWASKDIGHQKW